MRQKRVENKAPLGYRYHSKQLFNKAYSKSILTWAYWLYVPSLEQISLVWGPLGYEWQYTDCKFIITLYTTSAVVRVTTFCFLILQEICPLTKTQYPVVER